MIQLEKIGSFSALKGKDMLYKKNLDKKLSLDLFKNPTSEYRGAPFWAWNCELECDELLRQIDVFNKMGLGGFHMHVRTGMATEYLSEEFMKLIRACVDKARENNMLAYLYDEDRWPSGAAGGIVTKDNAYRQRMLRFTTVPYKDTFEEKVLFVESSTARTEEGSLITVFDVELDENGFLKNYTRISPDSEAKGTKWYAYMDYAPKTSWFNNQSYIDTMNKDAMDKFIDVTYEAYNKKVGDEFGQTVHSIFTDEPQVSHKMRFAYAADKRDVTLPWTPTFADTYKERYGEDIIEHLPELFWNLPDNAPSVTRYRYHDHVADRFSEAFGQNCGKWCDDHGIALTGHLMCEQSLFAQTLAISEAMRNYRGFGIPGIDMLCGWREFTTAKQAQSAVHQLGKEAMLSELYGVTGWDFDFRGHKLHGDWQAAMGVTVRVQHLSWVSMKGEAKRDYPASISYQSPWYTEYSRVEDHFARVNTALTRGKPIINVGVIHPIESYWLNWGPEEHNSAAGNEKDANFSNLTDWLIKSTVDFNFISEAMLPELCPKASAPLKVGKMAYDIIVVPQCETLRSTTLERLEDFKKAGGKLIFMGSAPKYENAIPSERGKKLYDESIRTSYTKDSLIKELDEDRNVKIFFTNGAVSNRYCHQLRQDGNVKWLFVAQAVEPYNKNLSRYNGVDINVKGEYTVKLYNTENGTVADIPCKYKNGYTVITRNMYDYDSLLLELTEGRADSEAVASAGARVPVLNQTNEDRKLFVTNEVKYTLSEPNVLLLDMAEYSVDGGEWQPKEEILRLDAAVCSQLGLPQRGGHVAQPWVAGKVADEHKLSLRFTVKSDVEIKGAKFATERLTESELKVNGRTVEPVADGWYVDKSIETVAIPTLHKGDNVIELTLPFGVAFNTEWCYLLGEFGVEVRGQSTCLKALPETVCFGDLTHQGLPFYGGNITYHLPVSTKTGKLRVNIPHYVGALITLNSDKGIIYPPYTAKIDVGAGDKVLDITLFGNRQNSFGHVHCADRNLAWIGPGAWRTKSFEWSYEYVLRELGIMSIPNITEVVE